MDLGFVLDGSGSITAPNFRKVLQFVQKIVQEFTISKDMSHVGIVEYSSAARKIFDFNAYYSKQAMLGAISRIPYRTGGTNTGKNTCKSFWFLHYMKHVRMG